MCSPAKLVGDQGPSQRQAVNPSPKRFVPASDHLAQILLHIVPLPRSQQSTNEQYRERSRAGSGRARPRYRGRDAVVHFV